jgi:hypothetical protein
MASDIKGRASVNIIRLGEELRALRRGARPDGLTLAAVVEGVKAAKPDSAWDQTKLSRIERATLLVTAGELDQLLDFYGLEGEDRDILTNLRTEAPTRRWWLEYEDVVSAAFGEFLQLENEADESWEYAGGCTFPGMGQSEGTAEKTIEAGFDRPGAEQVERLVEVRIKRQRRLRNEPKLKHTAYFSELALQMEKDPAVLADQLRTVVEMGKLENVTIRMVPVSAGRAGMLNSGLTLMGFQDAKSPKFVFVDAVGGTLRRGSSSQEVRRAEAAFKRLDEVAYSHEQTIKLLTQELERIS